MGAGGWRTIIIVCAAPAALAASMLFESTAASAAALFGVFFAGCSLAQFVFRRVASKDDIRGDLEDRVRNPPS